MTGGTVACGFGAGRRRRATLAQRIGPAMRCPPRLTVGVKDHQSKSRLGSLSSLVNPQGESPHRQSYQVRMKGTVMVAAGLQPAGDRLQICPTKATVITRT